MLNFGRWIFPKSGVQRPQSTVHFSMKKLILKIYSALLVLMLAASPAGAMHIIGGDFTYEYMGDGVAAGSVRYRFTFTLYRDCLGGGAEFDPMGNFAIYRGSETVNTLFDQFAIGPPVVTNIPAVPPPCVSNVPNKCVQAGVYVFEKELPLLGQNEQFFVVHQRCCRNTTIKNIVNPGDQGATYQIKINRDAMLAKNSSPVFKNFPPVLICANFPLIFDHSATDKDSDQLVYRFCPALAGGGTFLTPPQLYTCEGAQPVPPCSPPFDQVLYNVPTFSAAQPMEGAPTITINQTSGLISGTPTVANSQYVVSICVDEYRNGKLLSSVQREFQFNVVDCQAEVYANIKNDSIAGVQKFVINSCGDFSVFFKNESVQFSKINDLIWDFDLKNGSHFTATGKNNWDVSVDFPALGSYKGKLILNPTGGCGDTADISVNIYPELKANFGFDYDTCVADVVTFTDSSSGQGGIYHWDWDFGVPNGNSIERNPLYLYKIPGNHQVNLRVTDLNNCRADTTKIVNYFPAPKVIIIEPDKFLGCVPADVFFNNKSFPIDSTYFILWDFGDGSRDTGTISPHHIYTEEGFYDVKLYITSPLGCFVSDSFPNWIRIAESPRANFECDPDSNFSNINSTIKFIDKSQNAFTWNWQFDRFKTSTEQNPTFTFPDTGLFTVRLIVSHPSGCKDSMSKKLDFIPEIRWFMPNAFTPNGDGQNDGFFGKGFLEGATDFRMTIWNRWGELIFETTDPDEQWNGRVKNAGEMAPAGVYVYLVTLTDPRRQPLEFRGFATLIK